MEEPKIPTSVGFEPLNDQVLVKMDVKKKSSTIITPDSAGGDKPTVIPSGVVVAVGRGVFVPGTGFVENVCKAGDHVAISMEGSWTNVPLSADPNEVFVCVSESLLIGKLTGATQDSAWFKKGDESPTQTLAPRRR